MPPQPHRADGGRVAGGSGQARARPGPSSRATSPARIGASPGRRGAGRQRGPPRVGRAPAKPLGTRRRGHLGPLRTGLVTPSSASRAFLTNDPSHAAGLLQTPFANLSKGSLRGGAPHFREGKTEAQSGMGIRRSREPSLQLNLWKEFKASWKNRAKGKKIKVRKKRGGRVQFSQQAPPSP